MAKSRRQGLFLIFIALSFTLNPKVSSANQDVQNLLFGIAAEIIEQSSSQNNSKPKSKSENPKEEIIWSDNSKPEKPDSTVPKEAVSEKAPLCLSDICIGMTIDEVLAKKPNLIDGREVWAEEFKHNSKLIESAFGVDAKEAMKGQSHVLPANPDSKRLRSLKGIDPDERKYISEFYPENYSSGLYLDRKAMQIMAKATQCSLFRIKAAYSHKNDQITDIKFLPYEDDGIPRVVRIERSYAYEENQFEDFESLIIDQYRGRKISGLKGSKVEVPSPDIRVIYTENDRQVLIIQDSQITDAGYDAADFRIAFEAAFSERLSNQDICKHNSSKPTLE